MTGLSGLSARSFTHLSVLDIRPLSIVLEKVCPECQASGQMRLVEFRYESESPLDRVPRYPSGVNIVELLLCNQCQRIDGNRLREHRLNHQLLTFDQLAEHASKDECQWAESLHEIVGTLSVLRQEDVEIMESRLSDVYCWLCHPNTKIQRGQRIAYIRRLWTSFHKKCWTKPHRTNMDNITIVQGRLDEQQG